MIRRSDGYGTLINLLWRLVWRVSLERERPPVPIPRTSPHWVLRERCDADQLIRHQLQLGGRERCR